MKIAKINDKLKRAEQNVKKFKEETEKKVRYNNEISKMKYLNVVENKERQRRIQACFSNARVFIIVLERQT